MSDEGQDFEVQIPFIVEGFNRPYQSRLVLPQGTETVTDEAFRQFAEEMKEQYEILEADYNTVKRDCQAFRSELIRQEQQSRVALESYQILLKKLTKVISRDYPQYKFGDVVLDSSLNVVLPIYNEKTRRFTNYSNSTRSFLEIFRVHSFVAQVETTPED